MDRNSIIGLVIIAGIILIYSVFFGPTPEERAEQQRIQDSIAAVEQQLIETETKGATLSSGNGAESDSIAAVIPAEADSAMQAAMSSLLTKKYGVLAGAAEPGKEKAQIETDKFIITLASAGGKISRVELKDYTTYGGDPLVIFEEKSARFGVEFEYPGFGRFNTNDLAFEGDFSNQTITGEETKTLTYRLNTSSPDKYLEYRYTFTGNRYDIGFEVKIQNLTDVMNVGAKPTLQWEMTGLASEKLITDERNICTVFYKELGRNRDYLSETSDDEDIIEDYQMDWVAFKQKFFSAIVMADVPFEKGSSLQVNEAANDEYTKRFAAVLPLPVASSESALVPLKLYFGPNHYQTLKSYDRDLDEIINLGWAIFGWVNKFAVIPIFNFLDGFGWNYGIIILLLTIIIKIVLFPLMYKNYLSSAKMRVLKPDIDEMNEKMKDADPMKKQQATLELYRKTGVNPMSGCIPMLIQMPILYAMFRFFPSSIELRHESFLWADDLSSYDSILTLPFDIPMYGAHISLFTVLMAASTFVYTMMNSSQMPTSSQPGMPNMKVIMYIFPFMMLFFFNSFASGLSYYYLLANLVSIGQMVVIKQFFIDEDKIRAKITENKSKKDTGKRSRFQKKLEELSKQQQLKKK
jgi:YidC/Oxa1 family membrane protein insertase